MTAPLRVGSLFTGYGGLDMAVRAAFDDTELAWVSDIDPGACALLAHRRPEVTNLGDVSKVPWHRVPKVDILAGGFPCQDVSLAGLMAGLMDGTRSGLWIEFARAIDELRPPIVVIENVRGLCSAPAHSDLEPCPWCVGDDEGLALRALGAVLGDLADRGYDARWCGLRAADVGAPHGRYRIFILAWRVAADPVRGAVREQSVGESGSSGAPVPGLDVRRGATAHPDDVGLERPRPARDGRTGSAHDGQSAADADRCEHCGHPEWQHDEGGFCVDCPSEPNCYWGDPVDSDSAGSGRGPAGRDDRVRAEGLVAGDVDWREYEPAIRRWEDVLGRPAPAPTALGARGGRALNPWFVEWMQGAPEGWVCDVPGLTRNQMLRLLGNGVVWQQGAAALRWLADQMLADLAAAAA